MLLTNTSRGRFRRSTAFAVAFGATVAFALAGCGTGTGGTQTSTPPPPSSTAPSTTPASTTPAPAPVTITMWHYLTDRADLMQKLADEYKAQTGVTVKMELISSGDTLGQKFQAAAQSKTLPDLCAAWAGVGDKTAPYAKEGLIANLKGKIDAAPWSANVDPSLLPGLTFPEGNTYGVDPGPYFVPIDTNNMQFLYNKDLFAQAKITAVPTTWAEFLDAGKKLKAIGVAPFVAGFGSWVVDAFAQVYMWNMIGQDKLTSTFTGKTPYTDQAWVDFLDLFVQMRDAGILADGILADDDPAAESLFVQGQAGMIFDGSWAIGVFASQDPNFKNYGVFFPPSAGTFPVKIPGGVGALAFAVGTSPHLAEAEAFLQWLTEGPQQAEYANSSFNLPSNPTVASQQNLSDNLKTFSQGMTSLIPALPQGMSGPVDTTMQKGIQDIIAGKATPKDVAERMQLANTTGQAQ